MTAEKHDITIDGTVYNIAHDKYTGDWCVHSEGYDQPQEKYFLTKKGAIMYILDLNDVVNNDEYESAPDRAV